MKTEEKKTRLFDENGEPIEEQTTFFDDFRIAAIFGKSACEDTYKRAKKEWLSVPTYWTQAVIALNRLCWAFWYADKPEQSEYFAELFHRAKDDFYNFYGGDTPEEKEVRRYFFVLTD